MTNNNKIKQNSVKIFFCNESRSNLKKIINREYILIKKYNVFTAAFPKTKDKGKKKNASD